MMSTCRIAIVVRAGHRVGDLRAAGQVALSVRRPQEREVHDVHEIVVIAIPGGQQAKVQPHRYAGGKFWPLMRRASAWLCLIHTSYVPGERPLTENSLCSVTRLRTGRAVAVVPGW